MGEWAKAGDMGQCSDLGVNLATTSMTGFNCGNGSKGSWTQIGDSTTAHNANGLFITLSGNYHTSLVDIGIGTNPNQTVLIPNLLVPEHDRVYYYFPGLAIKSGIKPILLSPPLPPLRYRNETLVKVDPYDVPVLIQGGI